MADVKLDMDKAWVKLAFLGPLGACLVGGTVLYMQIKSRLDNQDRSQEAMVKSIDNLTAQIGRAFVDGVATRQAQAWIELARALNRDKNPTIVWPDLPR